MLINNIQDLAHLLKDCRKQQKLTQQRLSELTGLRQSTISHFEKDPSGTKIETLLKLLSRSNLRLMVEPTDAPHGGWAEEW